MILKSIYTIGDVLMEAITQWKTYSVALLPNIKIAPNFTFILEFSGNSTEP